MGDIKFPSVHVDVFESFFKDSNTSVRLASHGKTRISSLDQLVGMSRVASNVLVRHAQNDFWKIGEDEEGFFIERLVDDSAGPIQE